MNVLEKILEEVENLNYYPEGMGCGIEDCGITDRYEACEYGWNEAIETVVEAINNIEEAESSCGNDGWIPVSEKLPEEGQDVLAQFVVRIVSANNEVREAVYIHVLYYENGAWQSFAGVPNGKVEAWQPLPEPYKEE